MNDLFNQRQEREKKRIINYFCELLHGRDNKPAWSPWIWHICSENNTIISKGERSGENMRTPGLKCQWSIPVLVFIPENNNKHNGKHTAQTFINAQEKKQWPITKACKIKSHVIVMFCSDHNWSNTQTAYCVFQTDCLFYSDIGGSQKTCLTATESRNCRKSYLP